MRYFIYFTCSPNAHVMKKTALLLPLLVAGMLSCNNTTTENNNPPKADSTPVAAEPAKETPPPPARDSATMMKKMQEFATPGEMHKMLAAGSGKWDVEVTTWDMDPSKPPSKSKATSESKMIMNGLYQVSSFKGTMMGMPFEGQSTTGYDNARKVFVSTWIDNMGSGVMYTEGTYDAATKTLTMKGKMTDCTTDGQSDVKEILVFKDDKHQHMEMWSTGPDGKEYKWMESEYTKK